MKTCLRVLFAVIFVLTMSIGSAAAESVQIPVKDMVTLIDFGAHSCIPCKMMAPIIDKLQQDYKGKAAIIFIDVWKNHDQGKKYGIRAIPTQIIYDTSGKERFRHVGFWSEKEMKAKLDELLAL